MKGLEINSIEGYRSLKRVAWKPGDLNVLIGPNGGGKSNLLRFLELMKASADKRLAKHVREEGGMELMLWDGRAEGITFELEVPCPSGCGCLSYILSLYRIGKTGGHRIVNEILQRVAGDGGKVDFTKSLILDRHGERARVFDEEGLPESLPQEDIPEEETLLSMAGGPFGLGKVAGSLQSQLANWGIYPEFQTGRNAPARKGSVSRTETRLDPDGGNLLSVLHTLYEGNRDFKNDVNQAMQAAFGSDFEELLFPPEADQRIQLRVRWKSLSRAQSAADLSDGTLRFLHLLTILANPDPPALIAIDEPETGLHPAMQQIVAEYAVEASRRSQVVLTTHSPEFLDAFGERLPVITVVESQEGQTQLRNLSAEALRAWLKSFTLGEMLRTGEADLIEKEEG